MSLKPKEEATCSNLRSNVVVNKFRDISTIYARSFHLQHSLRRYIPSFTLHMTSPTKDVEEAASSGFFSRAPCFTKILGSKTAHHTAECCRLSLPIKFCAKHHVERQLTMTDSTGHKLWHMRFQSRGPSSKRSLMSYTISNGWREFSYDHSLKKGVRLVFTLLSSSHFVVEFAASNGMTRAMHPTRDGTDYPWKINSYRLACISSAKVQFSKGRLQGVKRKLEIRKNMASQTLPNKRKPQEEMFCQCNSVNVRKRKNMTSKTLPNKRKPQEEMFCQCNSVNVRKRKNMTSKTLPNKRKPQEEMFCQCNSVNVRKRKNMTSKILPNKQKPQEEMICQCNSVNVRKRKNSSKDVEKRNMLPKVTYLECKNPDGSPFLLIVDSDSEITGAHF